MHPSLLEDRGSSDCVDCVDCPFVVVLSVDGNVKPCMTPAVCGDVESFIALDKRPGKEKTLSDEQDQDDKQCTDLSQHSSCAMHIDSCVYQESRMTVMLEGKPASTAGIYIESRPLSSRPSCCPIRRASNRSPDSSSDEAM